MAIASSGAGIDLRDGCRDEELRYTLFPGFQRYDVGILDILEGHETLLGNFNCMLKFWGN